MLNESRLSRRSFLHTAALAGAGLGALGFANATFSDADFGVIGILLGNLARFMSKEGIMALIVGIFAVLVAWNYLGKKPAAEKEITEK